MDSEVPQFLVLEDISRHRCGGTAIAVDGRFIIIRGENKNPNKIFLGW